MSLQMLLSRMCGMIAILLITGCNVGGVKMDDTGFTNEHHDGPVDRDMDGHDENQDCDDHDASINPGAVETCNGIDDDCDGYIDDTDPSLDTSTATWWFGDNDGDGWQRERCPNR